MCCWWNPYARGVPCLWVKCLDRPSVPILGCSIELLGILFSLQMIQLKCHAANAWQCDNPSPSTVSYAAMCLGLPSSCLLTKEKPDCLTLVHTVRPSDAHRAYLHESDICRTLTILFVCTSDLYRSVNGDPCQGLLWVSKYYEWQALYKTVSQGLGHNSKTASPQSDWKQKRKPPCAKCTFRFSKHYFWRNPLAPTHFQILVWQRKVREEECVVAVTPRSQSYWRQCEHEAIQDCCLRLTKTLWQMNLARSANLPAIGVAAAALRQANWAQNNFNKASLQNNIKKPSNATSLAASWFLPCRSLAECPNLYTNLWRTHHLSSSRLNWVFTMMISYSFTYVVLSIYIYTYLLCIRTDRKDSYTIPHHCQHGASHILHASTQRWYLSNGA